MNKREERISVAIISEGETESWYFKQLSVAEKVHISTYPKEGKNLHSLFDKAENLIIDGSFDFIFGLIDLDVSKDNKAKLQKLLNLSKKHDSLYIIQSQPCFEYWFYLHRDKYSSRYFSTWKNENPLKPEIQKVINNYEKNNKFYRSMSGQGIYSFLRPKLMNASSNSLKLFNDKNSKTICEIFYVVGILFCSKCRNMNCTNDKFFDNCIKSKHLCEDLKSFLNSF
ncbi:MAG: RloB domain-containing protein [Candidatus Cloacimonetes bacterium]|nr:RloB domain-containing protein [Candidatus Cloacimonadota bacterium]